MSQHQQRPRDILEFLRRASTDEPAVEVAPKESAPVRAPHVTVSSGDTPMIVLRRSQVIVACVAAGLLIVLAFLLGLASSDSGEAAAAAGSARFYTIKLIEYPDTRSGEINAKTLMADLERRFDEEVTIERLDRDRKLVVALGSWLKHPRENRRAVQLLEEVKGLKVAGSDTLPFESAYFFQIKR
jgi:hypothetical protein